MIYYFKIFFQNVAFSNILKRSSYALGLWKIYKEIRKSKGLTQEEICGDFLARSTLARIESGQVAAGRPIP